MYEASFSQRVLQWFDQHGRKNLPWQQQITPYKVWLSEVMLQQTQVNTVIPYFAKFLQAFPDVSSLAAASEDEVLHLWSGLGYYSRARNLHRAAKIVVNDFDGEFPDEIDKLELLPGVGRSTAGAIRSSAFEKRAAILDGNVKRVIARHFAIDGWPGKTSVLKTLWEASESVTPEERSRAYTQAIMDLGALICKRSKPQCEICPLKQSCIASSLGTALEFPGKKPRKNLPVRTTHMIIIKNERGEVLLEKRPPAGVWAGLWSFPEAEEANKLALLESHLELGVKTGKKFRHTFSHYHLDITPVFGNLELLDDIADSTEQMWFNPESPKKIGLAAPVSKLIKALAE